MNRRAFVRGWRGLLGCGWAVLLGAGLLGCAHDKEARLQSDDEVERAKYDVKTIGEITEFGSVDPMPLYGVGLVTGLADTGGNPPQGPYLEMLRLELKRQEVKDYQKILDSPTTSVVIVAGRIAVGARKGDTFDLEVVLPPGSKTTSLRGGYLQPCLLWQYEFAGNLVQNAPNPQRMLQGKPYGRAEGFLQTAFSDGDEEVRIKQARVWGGGKSRTDVPIQLLLKPDHQFAVVADSIANRINETFRTPFVGVSSGQTAVARSKALIDLTVPEQYRHNLPRFMRVVRLAPMREAGATAKKDGEAGVPYRRQLQEDLLDPARTVTAALRLEALGADSVRTLKMGLDSNHTLVRFSSAEALAYLDSPSCGQELARLVEGQPMLRAYCLTAMASLDQPICRVKLAELLRSPVAEARYGAFRALRALDEREPMVQGELLNHAFWLHRTAPDSSPMVHLSTSRRAEIVLFGEDACLKAPFAIHTGEFVVTAQSDDDQCTIAHCSTVDGASRKKCSLKLEDVLRAVATEGGTYPEAVELIRQADRAGSLSCPVEVDALPQAVSVYALAKIGLNKKAGEESDTGDVEILNAKSDLSATPTLFEKDPSRRSQSSKDRDEETAGQDRRQQQPRK